MKFIAELSEQQRSKLLGYRQKWLDISLETAPADRERAEAAITRAYKFAGLSAPRIVWCSSPLSMLLSYANLEFPGAYPTLRKRTQPSVWADVDECVKAILGPLDLSALDQSIEDLAGEWVSPKIGVGNIKDFDQNLSASVRWQLWDFFEAIEPMLRAGDISVSDQLSPAEAGTVMNEILAETPHLVQPVFRALLRSSQGQHDAYWLAYWDYFYSELGFSHPDYDLRREIEMAQSAGWRMAHERICLVTERTCVAPKVEWLSCDADQAAFVYPDGFAARLTILSDETS